jgi:GNAT superfamily N-acetyltransferase
MARYEHWDGKVEQRPAPAVMEAGVARERLAHEMTRAEFEQDPATLWHGSPSGRMGDGVIHAGTQKAAYEAMTATLVGANASGIDWQPGEPLDKLDAEIERVRAISEHMAKPRAAWMNDPRIFAVRLNPERQGLVTDLAPLYPNEQLGDMVGSSDDAANSRIDPDRLAGYWYTNMSEDAGSRSLVVPSRLWLMTHREFIEQAISQGQAIDEAVLADYPDLAPRIEISHDIAFSVSVRAMAGEVEIGRLHANYSPGGEDSPTIVGVKVQPAWRRRGIATAMFEAARELHPNLRHSEHHTEAAAAWIESMKRSERPALASIDESHGASQLDEPGAASLGL